MPKDRRDEKEEDDDDGGNLPEIPSSWPRDAEQDTNASLSASVIQPPEEGDGVSAAPDSDDSEDLFEVSDTPQAKNSTFRERLKVSAGKKRRTGLHEEKGGDWERFNFILGKVSQKLSKTQKEQ